MLPLPLQSMHKHTLAPTPPFIPFSINTPIISPLSWPKVSKHTLFITLARFYCLPFFPSSVTQPLCLLKMQERTNSRALQDPASLSRTLQLFNFYFAWLDGMCRCIDRSSSCKASYHLESIPKLWTALYLFRMGQLFTPHCLYFVLSTRYGC